MRLDSRSHGGSPRGTSSHEMPEFIDPKHGQVIAC
jgi:hypothetical protein